jgi:hypothetical protein
MKQCYPKEIMPYRAVNKDVPLKMSAEIVANWLSWAFLHARHANVKHPLAYTGPQL